MWYTTKGDSWLWSSMRETFSSIITNDCRKFVETNSRQVGATFIPKTLLQQKNGLLYFGWIKNMLGFSLKLFEAVDMDHSFLMSPSIYF